MLDLWSSKKNLPQKVAGEVRWKKILVGKLFVSVILRLGPYRHGTSLECEAALHMLCNTVATTGDMGGIFTNFVRSAKSDLFCKRIFHCLFRDSNRNSHYLSARFTASYMRKMSIDAELLPFAAEKVVWSDFSKILENIDLQVSKGHYEEYAFGTADIDTLDSLFRFNVTYTNFSKGGVGVANSKTRATTLLMYDVVLGEYNSTKLYRAGTNFTWTSPSCSCTPISGMSGGSVRSLFIFVAHMRIAFLMISPHL